MRSWIEGGYKLLEAKAGVAGDADDGAGSSGAWLVLAVATRYVLAVGIPAKSLSTDMPILQIKGSVSGAL